MTQEERTLMSNEKLPAPNSPSQLERTPEGFRVRIRIGQGKQGRFTIKVSDEPEAERRACILRDVARGLMRSKRRAVENEVILRELAGATDRKGFENIVAVVQISAKKAPKRQAPVTFAELADDWTSGRLRQRYPDHVKEKRSVADDEQRLKVLNKAIGKIPLSAFGLEEAERAMASLPAGLSSATRRQYGQLIAKVLKLAVYPCRLLDSSPIPTGFLPRVNASKAKAFLYPTEEAALIGNQEIPLARRVLWGFLAREGMRLGEALALRWGDFDLERGTVRLDANKTDDPRMWALGPDVVRSLRAFRPQEVEPAALAFTALLDVQGKAAQVFRADLRASKIERPELFERNSNRLAIRVHDLRGTFVTLALSTGKTETWVSDRTGHKSSIMINRYRRAARSATELGLGWLAPLDLALSAARGESEGESAAVDGGKENVTGDSRSSSKVLGWPLPGSNRHSRGKRILSPSRLPFRQGASGGPQIPRSGRVR